MKLLEANKGTQAQPPMSVSMYLHNSKPQLATAATTSTTTTYNGNHSTCSSNNNMSEYNLSKSMSNGFSAKNGNGTLTDIMKETSLDLEDYEGECLEYTEEGHPSFVLAGINNLRKLGQFCDIRLVLGDHELPVHRAVLAACSPYLFDFLSCLEETAESQPTYKLKDVPYAGFQYLVDYMYTGRLHVPLDSVPVVYATALGLRMESASRACASFLSNHLTNANCLGIRRLTKDAVFKHAVDMYIRANLSDIMHCKSFFGLTDLQVEVVGLDEHISDEAMERRLFSLVLDWAKNNINDLKPKMDRLTEKVNVLYLDSDNTLRDCADVGDTILSSDDDMVQDYKIMARRRSKGPVKGGNQRPGINGNGVQPFHKFSLNPEEAVSVAEREWSIVATRKTSENAYLAIALLDGKLMAISVHVRPHVPSSNDSNGSNSVPDSPSVPSGPKSRQSPVLRKASITPLVGMSSARCAMGAVELNGQLAVFGGYDRGECLRTVEAFSIKDNAWTAMPPMNRGRARFSTGVLDGFVYVCGGSDGWKELSSVEKFDPVAQKWTYVNPMTKERSYHSVATLNGKLYVVGGTEGQRSVATGEMYDPATNSWSPIASLNTARSQTCVCAVNGLLFAIGGTDLWNTLSTVEVYDPDKDEWVIGSGLNIARRGASVDIVDGMVVVCGGSDGTQSLVSTEIYDFDTNTWTMGPLMNFPRANLSVVTIGDRLFAVGGFSGKKFLNSLEWLDFDDMEWFGHAPRQDAEGDVNGVTEGVGKANMSANGQVEAEKLAAEVEKLKEKENREEQLNGGEEIKHGSSVNMDVDVVGETDTKKSEEKEKDKEEEEEVSS